jgi:transposase InsO family protein
MPQHFSNFFPGVRIDLFVNLPVPDECLNAHWFRNLNDAKDKIEVWRRDYNEARPHRALNYLTPNEFAAQQENWSQKTKP